MLKIIKNFIKRDFSNPMGWSGYYDSELKELQQAIEHLIKAYKDIEEENLHCKGQYHLLSRKINVISVSLVEEKLKKDIIVGGRRNAKTLEYGKKLGRIEMCEELLEKRK